jgi:MFS family permease
MRQTLAVSDQEAPSEGWMNRGVVGIGAASFLSDVGHEVPTALLPSFLTSTLGAPASALGLIEGIADGLAGAARFAGGGPADDPERRRTIAVGGYTATAVLSSLIGAAGSAVQVGVLRAGAWTARGLRVPARNALLADLTTPAVYGRAYGFERAMDNLGAIFGPLLALVLVSLVGTRTAIYLSVIPGLLATVAIVDAIEHRRRTRRTGRVPIRWQLRPVLRGGLGHLMVGIGAFEVGNVAATLLILRATELLDSGRSHDRAVQLALVLYIAYNIAATLMSVPAGHMGDRHGQIRVLVVGVALFAAAYAGFAVGPDGLVLLAVCFVLAGLAIGCVATAEHAAVAHSAALDLRGSAFGILAAVQSFGNLAASAIAGILWTAVSPTAAFVYFCVWMLVAFVALITRPGRHQQPEPSSD